MEDVVEQIIASPIIALDTETTGEDKLIPFRAILEGASIAWIKKDGTIDGCYWTFDFVERGWNRVGWDWFARTLLLPLWEDESRTLVFQNAKFDLQVLLGRLYPNLQIKDIPEVLPKGTIEDTMLQAFLIDENLPKDLKYLSRFKLGKPRMSYEQTLRALRKFDKECKIKVQAFLDLGWHRYYVLNSKNAVVTAPSKNTLERIVDGAPPKLKKNQFISFLREKVAPPIEEHYQLEQEEAFGNYGKQDALDTLELWLLQAEELSKDEKVRNWYENVELPFSISLIETEIGGVTIDIDRLEAMEGDVSALLDFRREKIKKWVENEYGIGDFNPGSHDQIKDLLWLRMRLQPPPWAEATKKGLPPTSAPVLKWLAQQGHEICQELTALSALRNLQRTFVQPILAKARSNIHHRYRAAFKSVGAVTGRLSSSPNLQNITTSHKMPTMTQEQLRDLYQFRGHNINGELPPGWSKVETEDGSMVRMDSLREVFVPAKGRKYVVSDYSQIELRMIAHLSQDDMLIKSYTTWDCECGASGKTTIPMHKCPVCGAPDGKRDKTDPKQPVLEGFCLGLDIHSMTAVYLGLTKRYDFKVARKIAKVINFGLCYGEHWRTLAVILDVPEEEAYDLYTGYFRTYPGVWALHVRFEKEFKEKGVFPYILGGRYRHFTAQRVKLLNNLMAKWEKRKTVRDIANNIPQGSAIDIVKLGMLKFIFNKRNNPRLSNSHICLQVHDEVVVEVDAGAVEECAGVLTDSLEGAVRISVPILVDTKIANNWEEGK